MKNTRIIHQTTPPELYADLKLFCKIKGLVYSTYNKKKFPFKVDGAEVYRLEIITINTPPIK